MRAPILIALILIALILPALTLIAPILPVLRLSALNPAAALNAPISEPVRNPGA
jgi:hypothetical protein